MDTHEQDMQGALPFGAAFNSTNPEASFSGHQDPATKDQLGAPSDIDEPMLTADDNSHHVENMSLEQKKELLNKYNFTAMLKVGTYVDAADTTNNFLLAKIVDIQGNQVQVNFDGWSQKWNAWYKATKVYPFRSKAKGYSGQKKVAIRNHYVFSEEDLARHLFKVNSLISSGLEGLSAHETTQYLSGELFVFVDCLLGDTYTDSNILSQIDAFIKAVLRLIVVWLVKIPSLTKTLDEMDVLPNLFFVDPRAAIVEAGYELMDTLGKLFGTCMRGLRFFSFYDVNQTPPHVIIQEASPLQIVPNTFGVVVQDLTQFDLESRHLDDDNKYSDLVQRGLMRERKDLQYGFMLNWVQYFAQLGGFDATLKLLSLGLQSEKETKAPFAMVSQIIRSFRCLNSVLSPECARHFSSSIGEIVVKRLSTMTEQDVKVCNKDQVENVMLDLNSVLSLGMVSSEKAKIIEYTELSIGLRFLKSSNLEKRVKGLSDIRLMIDRVIKTNQYNKRVNNHWVNDDIDTQKLLVTWYMNTELMCLWLQQNKVLDIIFGQGAHIEIVKRAQPILNFIARQSQSMFDESTVELITRCQDGKHEEMIRTVYGLIENVLPALSLEVINMFFAKMCQQKHFDSKYLQFLKQFTIIALQKHYLKLEAQWQETQEDMSEPSEYGYNFDCYLVREEAKFIDAINEKLSLQNEQQENQYGIPIFWQLCVDGSSQPQEIRDLALASMLEMFQQGFRKTNRLFYLKTALVQLLQSKSIVQSAKVIKAVIKSYNIDQTQRMEYAEQEPQLIQVLQSKIKYLDQVVELLNGYHTIVKTKLKTIDDTLIDDRVFVGYEKHDRTLKTLLNHIKFLVAEPNVQLGVGNIELLWRIFVDEPNFARESTMFINWINRSKSDYLQSNSQKQYFEMFTVEEKKFIFLQILVPAATKPAANINLAKCFNTYFISVNRTAGALKHTSKRLRVSDFSKLQGLDSLWEISLNATNNKARDICQDLLVNLYLKQQEPNASLIKQFIDRCMQDVTQEGTVSLLTTVLDRFEGIKEIKVDADMQRRIPGVKPLMLKVHSLMNETIEVKSVGLLYYQSLGQFRANIAEAFNLQQNEFILTLKGRTLIDPETDDDKFMKDFSGFFSEIQIRRNPSYQPLQHPKFLLSDNQVYFEKIFGMFKTSAAEKLDQLYALFQKLPVNKSLKQSFESLQQVRESSNQQAWSELLDPTSVFKLLYCVQIISGLTQDAAWLQTFIQYGGFQQIVKCLLELNMTQVDSMLKLKCLKDLVNLVILLLTDELLLQVPHDLLLIKLFQQIEMICDFSIQSENKRGYSYEVLLKRIEAARIRKLNQKLHSYKTDKKADEQDDGDSEDKMLQTQLLREFKDQAEVVKNMFTVINKIQHVNPATAIQILCSYSLTALLSKGLFQSENLILRNCIACRIQDMLYPAESLESVSSTQTHKQALLLSELELVTCTPSFANRCFDFYKHLSILVGLSETLGIDQSMSVINFLANLIVQREVKERNATEQDQLLQGSFMLLSALLQKHPQQKSPVGQKLLNYLMHECLFEIPNNGSQAPKCKFQDTRKQALNLVAVLSRDCLQNLQHVLTYLTEFQKAASWRTPKESDWNIKLYNDEKSSTGRVGIKNLACICYMNSLNQQLFMIPGFRNDILSIQDPNNNNDPDEDNLFLQWQTLFTGLLLSEKMYVNPKSYCHAFKDWEGNRINVVEQMDVEEYLTMFFDKLEGAIKGTPQQQTIQYHFGGQLANEIICKGCPHQYERKEAFLTLGVAVKNKKSIIEGLDSFVSGDMLDEGNQYMCEKCDKKVDAIKRVVIKKLPRYLITTLKRFEFDIDAMRRVKVNDYYEFPHDLDMTKYTQEYLSKKEKGGEFTMKHESDYYKYELCGIVVHSGTADSGHYYSYIKEQENDTEKWYEFNDTVVRDFDKSEIPSECFGGFEQTPSWGYKGYMKTANAYIVVYKRKIETEQPDSDDEQVVPVNLGSKKLVLAKDSALAKKIAQSNQKYWQNRFLFSSEYTDIVCQLTASWNTNLIIPMISPDRNQDSHLHSAHNTLQSAAPHNQSVPPISDIPLQLDQFYTQQQIQDQAFAMFKFAATHYITVMQRAEDKSHLPTMAKYLKSYINYNKDWAQWFLKQFVNPEIIKECLIESSNKLMRAILVGLIYCAMLQCYEIEKNALMLYWQDYQNQINPRQTVMGNLILLILQLLPQLKAFNKNHSQVFQVLARFSSLGSEARQFMIQANSLECLLNYFYWDCSPYLEEFKSQSPYPFEINHHPDIGLPTVQDNTPKSSFQLLKRNLRLKRMQTEDPHFAYLVETVGNLARAIQNQQSKQTPYMLDVSTRALGEHDLVLFLPSHEFLEKLFLQATKPRIAQTITKAYLHHAQADESTQQKLWETVMFGLKEYEHHKCRPFFILFQSLLECEHLSISVEFMMSKFFSKLVAQSLRYYQWMETVFDFIWRLYTRVPAVRQWMIQNQEVWGFLGDWLDKNKEPPIQYQGVTQQIVKMNKGRGGILNSNRYQKHSNQTLYYYRQQCLAQMKAHAIVDLSQEPDLDSIDVQDFKMTSGLQVDQLEDKFVLQTQAGVIVTDLDEICSVRVQAETGDQILWVLTQKCKLFPSGLIESLHKARELRRIGLVLQKNEELEYQKKQEEFNFRSGGYYNKTQSENESGSDDEEMRDRSPQGAVDSTEQNFEQDAAQFEDFNNDQFSD